MGAPSPFSGALRSAFLPGWGQAARGRRLLGLALLVPFMASIAAVAVVAIRSPSTFGEWLISREALVGFLLLNFTLLGIHLWAVWDAWAEGTGRSAVGLVVVLLLVSATPHIALGWLHVRTQVAVHRVLAPAETTTTTGATTTLAIAPSTQTTAIGSTTSTMPTTTEAPTTTTTTLPPPPWGDDLTILLLGGDGGVGRTGIRTDAMIVAHIDPTSGALSLFSLPRNLRAFPFEEAPHFNGILNEVYLYGISHPDTFGGADPGASAILSVAEQITGLEIDYFSMVDFYAFVDIVNSLGGVTIYVPHRIEYPVYRLEDGNTTSFTIRPGVQELTGDETLAYVRSRKTGSDYGRMERQRCVLTALLDQADPIGLLLGLPGLITTFEARVTTDIPVNAVPDLVDLALAVDARNASLVTFGPPLWHSGWVEGGWPVPDVPKIQDAVRQVVAGNAEVLGASGVVRAEQSCGLDLTE